MNELKEIVDMIPEDTKKEIYSDNKSEHHATCDQARGNKEILMHGTVRAEQNKQANARAYQQSSEHGSCGKGAL